MEAIFFNLEVPFDEAINQVYTALGINYVESDSLHVLGGVYGTASLLGTKIKFEENSYDYEDKYRYSIFIDIDILSKINTVEKNITLIANVVMDLLCRNLNIEVAIEVEENLVVYRGSVT